MNEIMRQRKEALEALNESRTILARLRKLLREQESYAPGAFEESVNGLMWELGSTRHKLMARMSVLVALRYGRVKGPRPDSE
jgi:hypothetical protein